MLQLKVTLGVILATIPSIPVYALLSLGNKKLNLKKNILF